MKEVIDMKVSAVIVTYNRLTLLKQCLSHLLNQTYKLASIFVINNNSSDGTKKYLNNLNIYNIIPINLNKNLGGAGGFSIGTKIAYQRSKSDYFWLMDDDTMPNPSALMHLMYQAKSLHYNFGFLCSNVRWYKDGSVALTNIPQLDKTWNEPINPDLVKVRSASFVSVMFSRIMVKKLGLPISKMFIWGDDLEFTNRLSHYCNSYLVINSLVFHKSKENVSYNIVNSPRINYYKYGIRNKIYSRRKYDKKRYIIMQLFIYMFYLIRIPFLSKNKRFKRIFVLISGVIKGFFFNPLIKYPTNK